MILIMATNGHLTLGNHSIDTELAHKHPTKVALEGE